MITALSALIDLQLLDSAAEASRRRLTDLPAAEQEIDSGIAAAGARVDAANAQLQENQAARRALEKDVAAVDSRLSRFEDHKAAVKTNQEYTALLHEIATARKDKEGIEDRILALMEEGEGFTADRVAAEAALAGARREGDAARARFAAERSTLEAELARLGDQRTMQRSKIEPRALAVYDQLLKGRRGIAVARMEGEICVACHVRLRPHIAQVVRRNDEIVQCESCQRILYYEPPAPSAESSPRM